MTSAPIDWRALSFELEYDLERLAHRRFPAEAATAEDAHNRVMDRLRADDFAALQGFKGHSAPATYFTSVYRSRLEDVARSILGRCRPPRHIEQLGELWVAAFELLCCKRREPGELPQLLEIHYRPRNLPPDDWISRVLGVVRTVRGRVPDCGQKLVTTSLDDPEVDETPDPVADPEGEIEADEGEHLTLVLKELLTGGNASYTSESTSERLGALRSALRALPLKPDAVLLVRLVHLEDMSVGDAARMLGLNERTARRRIDELFEQLRTTLGAWR